MGLRSEALSGVKQFSLRFSIVLLVPALIGGALLYVAATQKEDLYRRNLRWLAQMAMQIHNRIQNHSNMVRDRAKSASPVGPGDLYSIESLKPSDIPCDPATWGHLTVVETTQERQVRFAQEGSAGKVCAYSDLSQLVEPAIRKGAFTSVVLAQRNGKVLYQSGPESLRITDVSFLFAEAGTNKNRAPAKPAAAPPAEPPTASVHITSFIGDTKYAVFVQPLHMRLRAEADNKDTDSLLIGLLEDSALLSAGSPNDMMVLLPLAVLLAALSYPLHKLWTLSPLDPLRKRDISAIALCSVGFAILLSLFGVSEYLRYTSTVRADSQLRSFAMALGTNLSKELSLAVQQLYKLDEIAQQPPPAAAPPPQFDGKTQTRTKILSSLLEPHQVLSPLDYADWIASDGAKNIRWTTRKVALQSLNVADRSYFKDVVSGDMLTLPQLPGKPFAIEQVLSRTSGRATTMIAIPSKYGSNIAASIAVNLESVKDPVAPRDLGFAIIDATGMVLFHSESSSIFVENFFDECRQSAASEGSSRDACPLTSMWITPLVRIGSS